MSSLSDCPSASPSSSPSPAVGAHGSRNYSLKQSFFSSSASSDGSTSILASPPISEVWQSSSTPSTTQASGNPRRSRHPPQLRSLFCPRRNSHPARRLTLSNFVRTLDEPSDQS